MSGDCDICGSYEHVENYHTEILERCPFCGGEGKLWHHVDEYWVRCEACNCKTPVLFNKRDVYETWNQRVKNG